MRVAEKSSPTAASAPRSTALAWAFLLSLAWAKQAVGRERDQRQCSCDAIHPRFSLLAWKTVIDLAAPFQLFVKITSEYTTGARAPTKRSQDCQRKRPNNRKHQPNQAARHEGFGCKAMRGIPDALTGQRPRRSDSKIEVPAQLTHHVANQDKEEADAE